MEEPDLRAVWQQGHALNKEVPSVAQTAQQHRKRSLNLVEHIKSTARREHRIFLIAAAPGAILLLFTGHYLWAVGLLVFIGLNIWKYEAEMHLFNRIRPEENTLDYLKAVSRLLRQFMRNYRIGILIFIPLVVLGSIFFGQWWVSGDLRTDLWQQPAIWLLLVLGIVAGILFSRWWLRFWVHTFYGSKLQEIEEIIRDLSDSK